MSDSVKSKPPIRRNRIIDALRKEYGGHWRYEYPCYWSNNRGFEVTAFSIAIFSPGGGEMYRTNFRDHNGNFVGCLLLHERYYD